jgi:hypothetical protein
MPSKVRILDPPHQQERPLTSTNMVRGRSSLGPLVSGPVRPSTGGCAEYVPKFRKPARSPLGSGEDPIRGGPQGLTQEGYLSSGPGLHLSPSDGSMIELMDRRLAPEPPALGVFTTARAN